MLRDNSKSLLVDNKTSSFPNDSFIRGGGSPKCIIKLEGDVIIDIQETKSDLFECELSKMVGKSLVEILPKYQPDGKLSKNVLSSLLLNLRLGNPVSTTLQIKMTSNQLHYADVNMFSFEENKYFLKAKFLNYVYMLYIF